MPLWVISALLMCSVGMIFLPNDDELEAQSKQIIEDVVAREGHCKLVGFRDVPVDSEVVGRLAQVTQPRICQVFLQHKDGLSGEAVQIHVTPVASWVFRAMP